MHRMKWIPHFLCRCACVCVLSSRPKHTNQLIYLVIPIHTRLSAFREKPCVCLSTAAVSNQQQPYFNIATQLSASNK